MDSRLQKRAGARVLASLAGTFLLAAGVLKADTLTWTASGGGMWSNAANWSSDGSHTVPQSGDTIKILGLKSGEVYENDIDGLSTPHLEFGGSTDSPYPQVKGKQVTLTGGMNALKTASGRIANYLPLVLTVQNGNPTNQFTNPGRLVQYGKITGPGLLMKSGGGIMDFYGGNEYTGGTVNADAGWLDPYALTSGDNTGNTSFGDVSGTYALVGTGLTRFNYATFPYNTVVRPPASKGATAGDFWMYSALKNFTGNITGTRVVMSPDSGAAPVFSGDIAIEGPVRVLLDKSPASSHAVTFSGRVECASFNDSQPAPSAAPSKASLTFNHADNAIGSLYVNWWNFYSGAVNSLGTNAVVYLGARVSGYGTIDLVAYDQCIDRFAYDSRYPATETAADMVGHRVTAVSSARLTMAATAGCTTDALFDGELTLAWTPKGNYAFATALPGRTMGMTGGIVVSNGTFAVNGTNSFPQATSMEVADGAAFEWTSGRDLGLRSVAALTLGEGASFSVAPNAAFPFPTNAFQACLSLDLAPGASLSLPSGTILPAVAVSTGGVAFAVGTTLCGDVGVEGTVHLPQLGAGVRVKVVNASSAIKMISTFGYVQDGLMCHLDAIDNAGRGVHNSSATMWKDLSGVAGDFGVTNGVATWTDNSLYKTRAGCMALNTVKCASMATLEAAVSRLNSISGDTVIPFYYSTDRYFCIRDASSLRKIWFQNGNSRASSSLPDEATIAAVYASPVAVFQNGAEEATSSDYNTWSANDRPANSMSVGGRSISWSSGDTTTYGYHVHALRMYNRALTAEELRRNYEVDSIRFHGVVPDGAIWYRANPSDPDIPDCRFDISIAGGSISVDGGEGVASATLWPALGDGVVLSATCDASHDFVCWSGDTNAIVGGTVDSLVVTVRVDRALSLSAVTRAGVLVVTADTCLTESVACRGIRFTGPWTLSAVDGVSLVVDEFGEGITVDEGTSGTAVISCPLTIGVVSAGDEQPITVPAGATLEIAGTLDGLAPLRISGAGMLKATGGGSYAGEMTVDAPKLVLAGTFSSTAGAITFSTTSAVELVGADLGKLLRVSRVSGVAVSCVAGTTNYLRSGWNQFTQSTTAQPYFDVLDNAELTIEGSFNGGGVGGIYPVLRGNGGVVHMRTDTDKVGCLNLQIADIHVWKPMFQVTRSNYNRLNSGKSMYLHVENALTKSPWQLCGYLDLCGHDQTMGRMSYVSEGSGSSWKSYTTGVVHSDAPATLTVYHDDNASGGGNHGPQVFGGTFTGAASLVKTGANGDLAMSTNHLILAGMSTSTGSIAVTWGLLSFTNAFTVGTTSYLGSWTNCTSATASEKGVLELCHSTALGRNTDVYVGTGGKVRLSSGVRQRVRYLYLPTGANGAYERQPLGTYGSSAAAGAAHKLDSYFEGSGILSCAGLFDGMIIMFR